MKKIITLGILLFALVSCRSSRPKYLRCSKGKRCVVTKLKKYQNLAVINTSQKDQETLIF